MTWLGGPDLVEHDIAHGLHRAGTIPILKGKYRDQIEWQCDVPFQISDITMVTDPDDMHGFHNYKGQAEPFVKTLAQLRLIAGRRINQSGPGPQLSSGTNCFASPSMEATL
jgi:hypothetical protein